MKFDFNLMLFLHKNKKLSSQNNCLKIFISIVFIIFFEYKIFFHTNLQIISMQSSEFI